MAEMLVTVSQVDGTMTSEGTAREHRVLIDRPPLTVRRAGR